MLKKDTIAVVMSVYLRGLPSHCGNCVLLELRCLQELVILDPVNAVAVGSIQVWSDVVTLPPFVCMSGTKSAQSTSENREGC